ncbi:MAG: response regulator [Pseudomonadota bacterium]
MKHRVLIVDDEQQIQQGLHDFFTDETRFDVRVAGSAEQALKILEDFLPTVCIVDMRLPGMNGNEFIKIARQRLNGCVFIIHTGSTEYELPDDFPAMGITRNNVIGKPVSDMTVFLDKIAFNEKKSTKEL